MLDIDALEPEGLDIITRRIMLDAAGSRDDLTQAQRDERRRQDLTARRAWTVADVRDILPPIAICHHGRGYMARIIGRRNDYATVYWGSSLTENHAEAEFAWPTIAAALNNGRELQA